LRDWLFSRQRYWGEPIPVVHKPDGSIIAVNESDLPLTLPQVEKYEPAGTGESPLANIDDWVNAPEGKRETNTMPQWAGSCWYYLRFVDPLNEAQSWSKEAESYWMPVDLYVGGVEHAVLHLLYSRFWHHVLHDLGLVSTREPFQKLFNQGMIQGEDGQKMSKSRGNVVNPDDVVQEYGADSFRLYEMFMGPLEKSKPWSTTGLQGCYRFVQKVWKLFTEDPSRIQENCASDETIKILHQSIKKVTEDLSDLRFNTSVSQLMIFVNHLTKLEKLDKFVLHQFLLILNPFAPHLSEELNQMLGYKIITNSDWPIYDKTKILEDKIEIAIQFNGKTRGKIHIANEESQIGIELSIKNDPKLSKYLYEKTIFKVIYIKNRIINFVLR
jgi:leucyl-tRNA synthetase